MLIHFAKFISNFLRLSEHWPTEGSERVPSLKDLLENLAFYPLLSLFMAATSSAYATDGLALRLSATIFAVVVFVLLLATALQTLSMLLSAAYGALRSIFPRDRVFQVPLISKLPAKVRPYAALLLFLAVPFSVIVISLVSITFVLSRVILGLLDG